MEHGAIEQSIYIDAEPHVVYEVVSSPEHVAVWFSDRAEYTPETGSSGYVAVGAPDPVHAPLTVVDAVPGELFSFRWIAPPATELLPVGATLTAQNSMLVTFALQRRGTGTMLTVTESGMREQGWEAAILEQYYNDHGAGWPIKLERLAARVKTLSAASK